MKQGIPLWIWWKVNKTETATWSEFSNGGKVIVKQILASEERNTSKRIALWELESGIRVWKLTILVKSFETEKL